MKLSLGQEIPIKLEDISRLNKGRYSALLPNKGNFTALEKMG